MKVVYLLILENSERFDEVKTTVHNIGNMEFYVFFAIKLKK